MSNRTLYFMTALVLVSIAVLFGINMMAIVSGKPPQETYMKYNEVRGIAVEHDKKLYTLNFKQQNSVIEILNRSVTIAEIKDGTKQKPDFDKIVIYQFDNKPDLILTPVTYLSNDLVYTQPQWAKEGYLMDTSEGQLKHILSQAYEQ